MARRKEPVEIPIWEKAIISMDEATAYTGIGARKLRYMTNAPDCDYVIWVGPKKMINRKKLDRFLDEAYSV